MRCKKLFSAPCLLTRSLLLVLTLMTGSPLDLSITTVLSFFPVQQRRKESLFVDVVFSFSWIRTSWRFYWILTFAVFSFSLRLLILSIRSTENINMSWIRVLSTNILLFSLTELTAYPPQDSECLSCRLQLGQTVDVMFKSTQEQNTHGGGTFLSKDCIMVQLAMILTLSQWSVSCRCRTSWGRSCLLASSPQAHF